VEKDAMVIPADTTILPSRDIPVLEIVKSAPSPVFLIKRSSLEELELYVRDF